MRRSLMSASEHVGDRQVIERDRHRLAVEVPPETRSPVSAKTMGLSVEALISIARISRTNRNVSRDAPCTWGMQRSE
jgi:hypothetical protein